VDWQHPIIEIIRGKQSEYGGIKMERDNTEKNEKMFSIVIDDWGDVGLNTKKSKFFGLAATITDEPEALSNVSERILKHTRNEKIKKGKEVKHRHMSDRSREYAYNNISKTNTEVVGVFVDKRAEDNPEWWYKEKERNKVLRKVLMELTDDVMNDPIIDNLTIIVDEHTSFKSAKVEKTIAHFANAKDKNIIEVKLEDSETGNHKGLMQSADIATGAFGQVILKQKSNKKIPIKVERITDKNTIILTGPGLVAKRTYPRS
jgi:hypothetical protein